MAILNEGLEWANFASKPGLQNAFRGVPSKTLIPAGKMLCRFITTEDKQRGTGGNEILLSPWWSDWNTTAGMLSKWKTSKSSPRQIIRARLAITSDFSENLDALVQIILTQPVYAWEGIARHQAESKGNLVYLGGGTQYFLPNLAGGKFSSNVASVHCFSWVDSLV